MKYAMISACLLVISLFPALGEEKVTGVRPATTAEIEQLFALAVTSEKKPEHMRVIVDISVKQPAWTPERIAAEVKAQGERIQESETNRARAGHHDTSTVLSNAIARSELGVRLLHVQEWYSGNKCRIDQTDETVLNHPTNGFHETFVDIHDPDFSPYESFTVNHQLRDAQLTKEPGRRWRGRSLWRAGAIDEEVALPILLAVADTTSIRSIKDFRSPKVLQDLKIDSQKAQQLRNNSNADWRLEADEESIGESQVVHFKLEGQSAPELADLKMPYTTVEYWLGQQFGKTVCFRASRKDRSDDVYFSSERENFESNGYPHIWKTTLLRNGILTKGTEVIFKEIDLNPKFTDQEAFAPAFPTNYIVSDVTFGKAILVQNPRPELKTVVQVPADYKRPAVISLILVVAVAPLCVAYFVTRRSHLPNK